MYDFTLTENQQKLATEKHNVLISFLERNKLPTDEYYDIVVFDFLRAVRMYDAHNEVCASFESIANICMAQAIQNYRVEEGRKREAEIFSLDDPSAIGGKAWAEFLADPTDLCGLICDRLCAAPNGETGISHTSYRNRGLYAAAV